MAKPNDQIPRLMKYAEHLKQRLSSAVPEKFKHRPEVFKEMVSLDLKKTLAKIEKLR
jgi:hypothetical protein